MGQPPSPHPHSPLPAARRSPGSWPWYGAPPRCSRSPRCLERKPRNGKKKGQRHLGSPIPRVSSRIFTGPEFPAFWLRLPIHPPTPLPRCAHPARRGASLGAPRQAIGGDGRATGPAANAPRGAAQRAHLVHGPWREVRTFSRVGLVDQAKPSQSGTNASLGSLHQDPASTRGNPSPTSPPLAPHPSEAQGVRFRELLEVVHAPGHARQYVYAP